MKRLFFISSVFVACCMAVFLLDSCADKKPVQETPQSDTSSIDSVAEDIVEELISRMPTTKVTEELFDDFFFNFASSRKVQKSRIDFPLPVVQDSKTTSIRIEEWKHDYFFMHNAVYTIIFDNNRQMSAPQDTSVNKATVEQIDLKAQTIKQYHFSRKKGEWRMNSIEVSGYENHPNASFLSFYNQFTTDSLFQIRSIADPLEFSGPDPDDELSQMEGMLMPEQWSSFAPPLPSGTIYNIVYGSQNAGSNQKILLMQGIANGFLTELVFQKKAGQWQLVRMQI